MVKLNSEKKSLVRLPLRSFLKIEKLLQSEILIYTATEHFTDTNKLNLGEIGYADFGFRI